MSTPAVHKTKLPQTGKIVDAYKNGETFRTYVLRYGKILSVKDWEDDDGAPMRAYKVQCDGLFCFIRMRRGDVVSWGYAVNPVISYEP